MSAEMIVSKPVFWSRLTIVSKHVFFWRISASPQRLDSHEMISLSPSFLWMWRAALPARVLQPICRCVVELS